MAMKSSTAKLIASDFVTPDLKRSRGWDQSDRFDEAWSLVAATYQRDVHVLANVVDITPKPDKKTRTGASR